MKRWFVVLEIEAADLSEADAIACGISDAVEAPILEVGKIGPGGYEVFSSTS